MTKPFNLPVHLPRGPEHYWTVARAFGAAGFTVGELAGCTNGVAYGTVQQWVNAMKRQGELMIVGSRKSGVGGKTAHLYAVVKQRSTPPVVRRVTFSGALGRAQQQCWNAMRVLPQFTIRELAVAASTEEHPVRENTANKYVAALHRAALIIAVDPPAFGKKGRIGACPGTWRLKKSADSGPRAPQIFQAKFVFDPNRSRIVGESEVSS